MAFSFEADVSALTVTSVRYLADSLGLPETQDHEISDPGASSNVTDDVLSSPSTSTCSSTSTPTSHMKQVSSESVTLSESASYSSELCAAVEKYKFIQGDNRNLVHATASNDVEKVEFKEQEKLKQPNSPKFSDDEKQSSVSMGDTAQDDSMAENIGNENGDSSNNSGHVQVFSNILSNRKLRVMLNHMRKTSLLCDVKVVCHGTVFTAHCAVLVAFSKFFATLINRASQKVNISPQDDDRDLPKLYTKRARDLAEEENINCCGTANVTNGMCQNIQTVSTTLMENPTLNENEDSCENDFNADINTSTVMVFSFVQDDINALCVTLDEDNMTNCNTYNCSNAQVFTIDSCINDCIRSVCSPPQTSHSADNEVTGTMKGVSCQGFSSSTLEDTPHPLSYYDTQLSSHTPYMLTYDNTPPPSSQQASTPPQGESAKLCLPSSEIMNSYSSQECIPPSLPPLDFSSLPSAGNQATSLITTVHQSLSPITPLSAFRSMSHTLSSVKDNSVGRTDFSTSSAHARTTASEEFSTIRSTNSTLSIHHFIISPVSPKRSLLFALDKHPVHGSVGDNLQNIQLCESGRIVLHATTSPKQLPSARICTTPQNIGGSAAPERENTLQQQILPNQEDALQKTEDILKDLLSINVNITEPDVLDVLLDYAYTGYFKKLQQLPVNKYCEVNYAARKMNVDVNVFTPKVLRQALSSKNFLDLWDLAEYSRNNALVQLVAKYVAKRLDTLWMSDELAKLTCQRLISTLVIASRRCSTKPNVILRSILSWLKNDPTRRSRAIQVFMPFIERSEISVDYAMQLLHHDDIVQCLSILHAELVRRIKKMDMPSGDKDTSSDQASVATGGSFKGTLSKDASTCSVGLSVKKRSSSQNMPPAHKRIPKYKRRPQRRSDREDSPSDTSNLSSSTMERLLPDFPSSTKHHRRPIKSELPSMVVVGEDMLSSELMLLTLNTTQKELTGDPIHLKVLHESQQTITFFDGYVILVGGERNYKREKIQTVTVCDIRSNWRASLPDMHLPRSNSAVFLIDSTLYVTGGEGRYFEAVSEVESLEMRGKALRWRIMACMKRKRSGHSIVRDEDGCAYVVGGGTNKCERFVPTVEKWFHMPSLPQEFAELRPLLALVDRKLIAVNYYRPSRIYVLDLDDDTSVWRVERLTGVQPNWIVSITSWKDTVYVLEDKLQMIYSFSLDKKAWEPVMKVARSQFKPLFITMKVGPTTNTKGGLMNE